MADRALTYEIRQSSTAAPARVFALLSDAPSWPSWFGPARRVEWEPGADPPVRLVKVAPGVTVREVVLEESPPTHHAYSIRSVLPIKDHRADVYLSARPDGGTDIRWVSTMRPKLPGTGRLLRGALTTAVRRLCAALVRAAEN